MTNKILSMEEVVERTGMSPEMIDDAVERGLFPGKTGDGWLESDIEALMKSLGTVDELTLEEDE